MDNMVYKEIKAHYRTLAMAAHMIGDACEALSKDFERLELASGQTPSFEQVFMKPSTEHEELEAIRRNIKASYELSPEDLWLGNPIEELIAQVGIDLSKDEVKIKEDVTDD